ncbi:TPA: hypothetical protein NJZ47_005123 [Vibrio parahaemolyticus]|nr:hypothetical protein [Vibrio parahaemolyticus]HCG5287109.1 hypothetical protein [Vibrio parahaemolyticus]
MNNNKEIIAAITNELERENKNKLSEIIKNKKHDLDTLKVLVPVLMPPHSKCKHFVNEDNYNKAVDNIACAIYITQNPAECNSDDSRQLAFEIVATIKASMKKDRKATQDLYNKQVKTNFTTAQFDKLQHLRKSLNYSSIAAFVRDAAIQALDIKPRQDNEFQQHFEETAKLSRALRHIAENLDDKECIEALPSEISALKKDVDITRRMVVESHSSATAKILAEKFLSVRQLEIILKKKLEEENQ